MTYLGDQVQTRRESKGWTRTQLAQRAGLTSDTHVRLIETGERRDPRASTVCKLAGALGVTPNELLIDRAIPYTTEGGAVVVRFPVRTIQVPTSVDPDFDTTKLSPVQKGLW